MSSTTQFPKLSNPRFSTSIVLVLLTVVLLSPQIVYACSPAPRLLEITLDCADNQCDEAYMLEPFDSGTILSLSDLPQDMRLQDLTHALVAAQEENEVLTGVYRFQVWDWCYWDLNECADDLIYDSKSLNITYQQAFEASQAEVRAATQQERIQFAVVSVLSIVLLVGVPFLLVVLPKKLWQALLMFGISVLAGLFGFLTTVSLSCDPVQSTMFPAMTALFAIPILFITLFFRKPLQRWIERRRFGRKSTSL